MYQPKQKERWQDHKLKTAAKVAGLGMVYRYKIHGNRAKFRAQTQMFHRDVATAHMAGLALKQAKTSTKIGVGGAAALTGGYLAYHNRDSIKRGAQRVSNYAHDFKHQKETRHHAYYRGAQGYSAVQVARGTGNVASGARNRNKKQIAYGTGQVASATLVMSEAKRRKSGKPFRPRKGKH